jgi:hypothetical protein
MMFIAPRENAPVGVLADRSRRTKVGFAQDGGRIGLKSVKSSCRKAGFSAYEVQLQQPDACVAEGW